MAADNSVSDGVSERARWANAWPTIAALVILTAGACLRLTIAVRHSADPAIDENEVVEQAAAFLGPDLTHHFLKYGPLTMYVLSGIYRIAAWLHGQTNLEYASRVFFEGAEHYTIARIYTYGWLSVLALAAFIVLRRQLGNAPALLACTLLSFPFVEILLDGARIDTPQAAFQGLALLALTEVVSPSARTGGRESSRLGYWLAAGCCAGLAFASKPLPGLLIAPAFPVASWLAAGQSVDGRARSLPARLGAAIASKGLWLAALACIVCGVAGDPAVLDLRHFIQSQTNAVALHSGHATVARTAISVTFGKLQTPFLAAVAVSAAVLALAREPRAAVIATFVIVYVSAFVGRANRLYFMVAPAAALCLFVGYGWAELSQRLARLSWPRSAVLAPWARWAWVPLAVLVVQGPARGCWRHSLRVSPTVEITRWIEANVPAGTRLFHLGRRPLGTYLMSTSEKVQASWGDHFQYDRHRYRFFREAFHLAYANYVKSGKPRYAIEVHGQPIFPRSANRNRRWVTDGLVKHARQKRQKYIVIAGHRRKEVHELGYRWLDQAKLELQFGGVAIFSVPDEAKAPLTPQAPEPLNAAAATQAQVAPSAPVR